MLVWHPAWHDTSFLQASNRVSHRDSSPAIQPRHQQGYGLFAGRSRWASRFPQSTSFLVCIRILYELLNEVTAMFCMRVFLHLWYRGESIVFCTFKCRFNTNIGFRKYIGVGCFEMKKEGGRFVGTFYWVLVGFLVWI